MKILVFGNEIFEPDGLPVKLLPRLRTNYPEIDFIHADPNEEWDIDEVVTVIDTIINAKQPIVFESLEAFDDAPRVSMHDFDALSQLKLLMKLGRIKNVKILGLPPSISESEALKWLGEQLT